MIDPGQRTVREAMTHSVLGISPGTSVAEALGVAREHGVSHLPVVADGHAIGVVCTCDLEESVGGTDVSAIMHAPPVEIEADRTLAQAAVRMAGSGVGSLLVQSNHQLAGILTRTDLEHLGINAEVFGARRCSVCGSPQHVQLRACCGRLMCSSCRAAQTGVGPARVTRSRSGAPGTTPHARK